MRHLRSTSRDTFGFAKVPFTIFLPRPLFIRELRWKILPKILRIVEFRTRGCWVRGSKATSVPCSPSLTTRYIQVNRLFGRIGLMATTGTFLVFQKDSHKNGESQIFSNPTLWLSLRIGSVWFFSDFHDEKLITKLFFMHPWCQDFQRKLSLERIEALAHSHSHENFISGNGSLQYRES